LNELRKLTAPTSRPSSDTLAKTWASTRTSSFRNRKCLRQVELRRAVHPHGHTDIGGIRTTHLPDVVVALFTANEQSLTGVADTLRGARFKRKGLPVDRAQLLNVPVPTRDESQSEHEKENELRARVAAELKYFYAEPATSTLSATAMLVGLPGSVDLWTLGGFIPEPLALASDQAITRVALSHEDNLPLALSRDRTVRIWRVNGSPLLEHVEAAQVLQCLRDACVLNHRRSRNPAGGRCGPDERDCFSLCRRNQRGGRQLNTDSRETTNGTRSRIGYGEISVQEALETEGPVERTGGYHGKSVHLLPTRR
jgi:hypothetical protein